MNVVVDLELTPGLDEVRELARTHNLVPLRHTFIADCETPVSAYLKLRGGGPSFLLESAEQGQRVGRWSFLGFRPRTTIRMSFADHPDPYGAVAEELGRYRIAPLEGLPPFAGGAVGMFGYDLVRSAEPSVGEPNPDETGIPDLALMITDVLVAFDHLRHEVTVLANVLAGGGSLRCGPSPPPRARRPRARLRAGRRGHRRGQGAAERPRPADRARPRGAARVRLQHRLGRVRRGGRAGQGVHPRGRRLPGRAEPALDGRVPGRRLLDLPRPARDQPEPVHVLPRLRGLRGGRGVAGGARDGQRQARGAQADRRHAPAHRLRPRAVRRAAGRREGARGARDAGRPRPQRPRPRVRVRQRDRSTS